MYVSVHTCLCIYIYIYIHIYIYIYVAWPPKQSCLRGLYRIGLPSKGRQEFGAGRLVLWGALAGCGFLGVGSSAAGGLGFENVAVAGSVSGHLSVREACCFVLLVLWLCYGDRSLGKERISTPKGLGPERI